jgi:hypothetical protein
MKLLFIAFIRLPHLEQNELQDIVFLCTSQPKQKTLDLVNRFPRVHFMVVSIDFHFETFRNNDKSVSHPLLLLFFRAIANILKIYYVQVLKEQNK